MRDLHAVVLGTLAILTGPTTGSAPQSNVQFNPPQREQIEANFTIGQPVAYSLCLGRPVDVPQPRETRTQLNPAQSPCGGDFNPSATVTGGQPPYHFVLESGWGFPPMGMVMDVNGVLRGTPTGRLPATFRVCAVDVTASQDCQTIVIQPRQAEARQPPPERAASANTTRGGGGGPSLGPLLILGAAGAAAVGAAVALKGASESGGTSAASGSGACSSNSQCNAFASRNNCSPARGFCTSDGLCHCCFALCTSAGCNCLSCSSDRDCGAEQCFQGTCIFRIGARP